MFHQIDPSAACGHFFPAGDVLRAHVSQCQAGAKQELPSTDWAEETLSFVHEE
jgi:hypothetical protein